MSMLLADDWKDYELIDTGGGEKLERWGKYTLRRPDPQAIWPVAGNEKAWRNVDAHYHRSSSGGGRWEYFRKLPAQWTIKYGDLEFFVEPTGFKHTGLFPEQAVNWKWIESKIRGAVGAAGRTDDQKYDREDIAGIEGEGRRISVLNLFAYTGGATVAAAHAGAEVCHVDASKGMVARAKENLALSKLADRPVRFIVDDVVKFVARENRRGRRYDAVIMDPPSYGRGPNGELWKIEDEIYGLITQCMDILTEKPLFFLVNSYTTGLSPTVIGNMLKLSMQRKFGGGVTADEIGLPVSAADLVLPCGASGRWEAL
jgi:23S rRNA (cytosine1962-C5)-methyltransferase